MAAAFNIEEPEDDNLNNFNNQPLIHEQEKKPGCFPFKLCGCLPSQLRFWLPNTVREIQDYTHLSLAIVIVYCMILVVVHIVTFFSYFFAGKNIYAMREFTVFLITFLVLPYCFKTVTQFDTRLLERRDKVQESKEQLQAQYHDMISGMHEFLEKFMKFNTSMAENLFEGKLRTFRRWLAHVKQTFPVVFTGSQSEHDEVVVQFKLLAVRWFEVLQECSIDPVEYPFCPIRPDEFDNCNSVEEVCNHCLRKLEDAPTLGLIIGKERENVKCLMNDNEKEVQRLQTGGEGPGLGGVDNPADALEQGFGVHARDVKGQTMRTSCCPSWIVIGHTDCKFCQKAESNDGYPRTCGCICTKVIINSPDQVKLLAGWLLGCLLVIFHIIWLGVQAKKNAGVIFAFLFHMLAVSSFIVCLFVVLVKFDDIDFVQQMEVEIRELDNKTGQVKKQSEEQKEFWNKVQDLNGVWLYRTIPRLDLLETVSHKLEDSKPEEMKRMLAISNQALDALEKTVGAIENWKGEAMSDDDKQKFAKHLKKANNQAELIDVVKEINEVNNTELGYLRALPPPNQPGLGTFNGLPVTTGSAIPVGSIVNSVPGSGPMSYSPNVTVTAIPAAPGAAPPPAMSQANLAANKDGFLPMIV